MTDSQTEKLIQQYELYNSVIKPLIATYEAREKQFPTPIFNEIRAFNDHIARCYMPQINSDFIDSQLIRASRHLNRIILDCYKYLIISYYDSIKLFEKRTKNIDLTIINDGDFTKNIISLKYKAIRAERDAKKIESKENGNDDLIYQKFEIAFNLYCDLDKLIFENHEKIQWAKIKSHKNYIKWIVATLGSAGISWVLTTIIQCK